MNETLAVYIEGKPRGLNYNPMYKFESINELIDRVNSGDNVPDKAEVVVEAYRFDNLVCLGATFGEFVENMSMISEVQ